MGSVRTSTRAYMAHHLVLVSFKPLSSLEDNLMHTDIVWKPCISLALLAVDAWPESGDMHQSRGTITARSVTQDPRGLGTTSGALISHALHQRGFALIFPVQL